MKTDDEPMEVAIFVGYIIGDEAYQPCLVLILVAPVGR